MCHKLKIRALELQLENIKASMEKETNIITYRVLEREYNKYKRFYVSYRRQIKD